MKGVNEISPVVYNSNGSARVYIALHVMTCLAVSNCELSSPGKVFFREIPVVILRGKFPYNFGWSKPGRNSGKDSAFLAKVKNVFP